MFICELCNKIVDYDSLEDIPPKEYNDLCEHNFILFSKDNLKQNELNIFNKNININEIRDTLNQEIIECEILSTKDLTARVNENFKIGVDYTNELNSDIEKMYNELKQKSNITISLPEFKELMESITSYDANTHQFMNLLNSKIIQKYTTNALSKVSIGINKLLDKMLTDLLARGDNTGEDEVGFENTRLILLGTKAINEVIKTIGMLKEYEIPEIDRKLNDINEKEKKDKENELTLSSDDIKNLIEASKNYKLN